MITRRSFLASLLGRLGRFKIDIKKRIVTKGENAILNVDFSKKQPKSWYIGLIGRK